MSTIFENNINFIKKMITLFDGVSGYPLNKISIALNSPIEHLYLAQFEHNIILYKDDRDELILSTINSVLSQKFLFYIHDNVVKFYLHEFNSSDKTMIVNDNIQISKNCSDVNEIKFYDKNNKDINIKVDLDIGEDEYFQHLLLLNTPDYEQVKLGIEIHKSLYLSCKSICNAVILYDMFENYLTFNNIDVNISEVFKQSMDIW